MNMNKIMWEEKRDIASLVALGAINRAPTRGGRIRAAGASNPCARRRVGAIDGTQARAAAMCLPVGL
jgi:hypothetical protein